MLIMLSSCTGPETLNFQKFKCKKDKSAKGEKNSVTKFLDSLKVLNSLIKGCLSLFNYFVDMSPTLMSPFFAEKHGFFLQKHVFFDKKWTHMGGAHIYKMIK